MNRNSNFRLLLTALIAACLLSSGCSWFRTRTDYTKTPEMRPLVVPPDLDTPPTSNELIVPVPGAVVANSSSSVSSVPPGAAALTRSDLHVADTAAHAWTRVGLALERAQIGTLSARDETARTYTLEFNGTVQEQEAPPEHHWYSRVLHPFGGGSSAGTKSRQVSSRLNVKISDDNGGARISVEGDSSDKAAADAAKRVMDVLRQRLS